MRISKPLFISALLTSYIGALGHAQTPIRVQTGPLVAGGSQASIGTTIDVGWMNGEPYQVIGSPAGDVVEIRRSTHPTATLVSPVTEGLGHAVDLSPRPVAAGYFVAMGAPFYQRGALGEAGRVWIFDLVTRTTEYVESPRPGFGSHFGWSVALGERGGVPILAVGEPDDETVTGRGMVHIFVRDQSGVWISEQTLYPFSHPDDGDRYGLSVAIEESDVLVGAPGNDHRAVNAGAVYFHHNDGGGYSDGFAFHGTGAWDELGSAVALDGDWGVAGAPYSNIGGSSAGEVLFFDRNGATFRLHSSFVSEEPNGRMGASLDLFDGGYSRYLVVGRPGSGGTGAASLFVKHGGGSWQWTSDWIQQGASPFAAFGSDVAISDQFQVGLGAALIAVGAPGAASNMGQVVLHNAAALTQVYSYGADLPGYQNQAPQLSGWGQKIQGHRMTLTLTGGRPNAFAVMILGTETASIPLRGGTLDVRPDALFFHTLDAQGRHLLDIRVPDGLPPIALNAQTWVADPDAIHGVAGSRALRFAGPFFD